MPLVGVDVVGDGDGDDNLRPRRRSNRIERSVPPPRAARRDEELTKLHGPRPRSIAGLTDFEIVAVAVAVKAHVND
jgi:hypothetical protein